MLNDPMLLGQILLREALEVTPPASAHRSQLSTAPTKQQLCKNEMEKKKKGGGARRGEANRSVRGAVGELLAYELVHPVGLLVGGAG